MRSWKGAMLEINISIHNIISNYNTPSADVNVLCLANYFFIDLFLLMGGIKIASNKLNHLDYV
ncbi:hypothetical protein M0Q03_01695 [bacterium]|jgi:hypothetical protein|nr:hypothetical protein [bacterium]